MKLLCWTLLCFTSLYAHESPEGRISSLDAFYDGSALTLQGNVKLNHSLGEIEADQAILSKQDHNSKELHFSVIDLKNNVFIDCQNKAKISCDSATLDFSSLQGTLLAAENHLVNYTSSLGSMSTNLQILSKKAFLTFSEQEPSSYLIDKLTASDQVTIYYGSDYILHAQEAFYHKKANQEKQGLLCASGAPCTLLYQKKPTKMTYVEIDTEKDLLYLKKPQGSLPSRIFTNQSEEDLLFQCEELYWNQAQDLLILKNHVLIQENHFGSIATEEEMQIKRQKNILESIHIEGKSSLAHNLATLDCTGSFHVDGLKGQISAHCLQNELLTYTDPCVSLKAEQALLEYEPESHELSALTLHKNVQIHSHDPSSPNRYGLADHLRYVPSTKTVILLADPGKKVLFWDEEQEVTLSAKEVHLTQNLATGKIDIQGIGNLKLSLSSEELSLLKDRFSKQSAKLQQKENTIHE